MQRTTLLDHEIPLQQKGDRVGDFGVLRVASGKLRLIPPDGLQIEAGLRNKLSQYSAVVAVLRRIAQKALQLTLCALLITRPTAHVTLARVALQVQRLLGTRHLGHVKGKHMFAIDFKAACLDLHHPVELLPATQRREKVILYFVWLFNSRYLHAVIDLADAKHQPATCRISKGRDSFIGILGHTTQGALALKVIPLKAI